MLHIGDRVQNKDGKISYIVQLYSNKDIVLVGFEGTNVIKQYTTKQFLSGETSDILRAKKGQTFAEAHVGEIRLQTDNIFAEIVEASKEENKVLIKFRKSLNGGTETQFGIRTRYTYSEFCNRECWEMYKRKHGLIKTTRSKEERYNFGEYRDWDIKDKYGEGTIITNEVKELFTKFETKYHFSKQIFLYCGIVPVFTVSVLGYKMYEFYVTLKGKPVRTHSNMVNELLDEGRQGVFQSPLVGRKTPLPYTSNVDCMVVGHNIVTDTILFIVDKSGLRFKTDLELNKFRFDFDNLTNSGTIDAYNKYKGNIFLSNTGTEYQILDISIAEDKIVKVSYKLNGSVGRPKIRCLKDAEKEIGGKN